MTARWPAAAWTWTQTWTLAPDQPVVKVLSAQKSLNKLCGVWFLLRPIKMQKLRTAVNWFQVPTLIPQTAFFLGDQCSAWELGMSPTRPEFFSIFDNVGKNLVCRKDRRLYNHYNQWLLLITAHMPGQQMWAQPQQPRAQLKCSKTVKPDVNNK